MDQLIQQQQQQQKAEAQGFFVVDVTNVSPTS